jgi:RHS repeat-associated protein
MRTKNLIKYPSSPYSFQGQEHDDEVKGEGNSYDFGARMLDARVGRWLGRDMLEAKYTSISPYVFVANMPTIAKDPDGERIIIVVYSGDDQEHKQAAYTRVQEIKGKSWFNKTTDKVIFMKIDDLGDLNAKIKSQLTDKVKAKYGKTIEFSYFGHAGTDGPVGKKVTSGPHNAFDEDGVKDGHKQLSLSGWAEIDFNFREDASIAAFYGCSSAQFASKFAALQKASHTLGYGSTVGASEEHDAFDANYYYWEGEDLYMWDVDGVGATIYMQNKNPGSHRDYYGAGATEENGWMIPNDPTNTGDWNNYFSQMMGQECSQGTFSCNVSVDAYGKLSGHKVIK